MDAYPSSPSHRRGGSCDGPSAVRVQLVPGSPEVRGHTSSGTTAVVWGTLGWTLGWTPPTLGPLGWTPPNIAPAPRFSKVPTLD